MQNRRFAKDFMMILVSNTTILISSIITGLILPKLLGLTNYGLYKVFTLYMGYTALLHFGFVDGILLVHAGQEYASLDKRIFRKNTTTFAFSQVVVSALVIFFANIFLHDDYRTIFTLIGIDLAAVNITTYYQSISQSTMRFKELSLRKVLQAVLKILCIVLLWVLNNCGVITEITAFMYIGSIVGVDIVLLGWYCLTYRDITFGKGSPLRENWENISKYFKLGISLTVAYQVASLILNLDRQFVSVFFDTETFAAYAFAYTLIGMITTVTNSFSIVLFPQLKQKTEKDMLQLMPDGMALISVIMFAAHLGYYPLCKFITWYLPEYCGSIPYLKVIFPSLAVSGCINTIIFTYYKAINKNHVYFVISALILAVSAVLNGVAVAVFHTPEAISFASIIALIIWYFAGESYFVKKYHIAWRKNAIYLIVMTIVFYITSFGIKVEVCSMSVYAVVFVLCTLMFYRTTIKKYIRVKKS